MKQFTCSMSMNLKRKNEMFCGLSKEQQNGAKVVITIALSKSPL